MGDVYRAMDTKLGRQVAVKVLPGHLAADPSARERRRREASADAALDRIPPLSVIPNVLMA
jgi:serine/threonine-protein kinase